MSIDNIPLWGVLLGTIVFVLLALEAGVRFGRSRAQNANAKLEVSGAMVGATTGLMAFMLAFTFNGASNRNDDRAGLLVEETNAIGTAWLRAGLLPAPYSDDLRRLLREYVDVRLKAATREINLPDALRESEALQDSMWAVTLAVQQAGGSNMLGMVAQSLNEVIEIHLQRVTAAVRNGIPSTIWETLYLLLAVGMLMVGTQIGLSGSRHRSIELALAVVFALVMSLITDLDRPQEGLVNVNQQPLVELRARLEPR